MNVKDFALRIQLYGPQAALLIGFDGGAAIMNHHRPELVLNDLFGDAPSGTYRRSDIKNAWAGLLGNERRRSFMREHTATAAAGQVDIEAVQCLAGLVSDNYIRAIVCTDTNRVLYNALKDASADLTPFDCSLGKPDVLEKLSEERMFVDGGELLLNGFEPDIFGYQGPDLVAMREGLKKFLDRFRHVYCWGWCGLNTNVDWICPDKPQSYFTAIGTYTSVDLQSDYDVVERPGDQAYATNDIWHDLDRELYPRRPGRAAARSRNLLPAGSRPAEARPMGPKRPLLNPETFRRLSDQVGLATISFIGVEPASVRTRCAHWLRAMWQQEARTTLFCSSTDTEDLARYLIMVSEPPDNGTIWAIGVMGNGLGGTAGWSKPLLPATFLLRDLAHRSSVHDYHAAIFVPVEVADWVAKEYPKESEFLVKSFFEADFLVLDVLADWLVEHIAPLTSGLNQNGAQALGLAMLRDAVGPRPADWLHDALDWWCLMMRTQELGGASSGDGEITLDKLLNFWSDLGATYRQVTEEMRLDFELEPPHDLNETDNDHDGDIGAENDDSQEFSLNLRVLPPDEVTPEAEDPEAEDEAADQGGAVDDTGHPEGTEDTES